MSTINFNDGIFAQEALTAFVSALTPLSIFSHSYSAEAAQKGNAIYVPRVDALVATTFAGYSDTTFPYENSGGTINTITVNLNSQFIQTCDLTDLQVMNSSAADFSKLARIQGQTLAKTVLQSVLSVATTGNFGAAVLTGVLNTTAVFNRSGTVSIRTAMAKRDVPMERLSLLLNEDVQNSLLQDPTIFQAFSFGGPEAIRDGNIPRLAGMDVYHTNILPSNGISLVGIAAHPDSIAVACRYLQPQDPGAYAETRRLVDPVSGVVMGYRRHMNPGRGKMYASFEALFGFAVGLSLGLGLLTRTD